MATRWVLNTVRECKSRLLGKGRGTTGQREARARGLLDGWAERSLVVVGAERKKAARTNGAENGTAGQMGKKNRLGKVYGKRDSWADGKEESVGQSIWHGWARLKLVVDGQGWSGMVVN
ncbi:hypothetical protein ACFE04_007832 [Oxalis oulophora]